MKKLIVTIAGILAFFGAWAQPLALADAWFDKYEYSLASAAYQDADDKLPLRTEDLERWCYAAFKSHDYGKSYELASRLGRVPYSHPFFGYALGYSAFALKKYPEAKKAFFAYAQTGDKDYFVDSLIVACDVLSAKKTEEYLAMFIHDASNEKSDVPTYSAAMGYMAIKEEGADSAKNVTAQKLAYMELMISVPRMGFAYGAGLQKMIMPDSMGLMNITSVSGALGSDVVYFTVTDLLAKDAAKNAPRIFEGKLTGENTVSEVRPWLWNGEYDTSYTAHATVHPSGKWMVFSKQGNQTAGADLYYSYNTGSQWQKPMPLVEANSPRDEIYPVFINDTVLAFASDGRVGYGGMDIYTLRWHNDSVRTVIHLGEPVNSPADDFSYILSQTGDTAFFASNRFGGKGDDDIYVIAYKETEREQEPEDKKKLVDAWEDIVIYYDFDKFDIKPEYVEPLQTLDKILKAFETYSVSVIGHTDERGSENYNYELGLKRAEEAKNKLLEMGFEEKYMVLESKGKTQPAVQCVNCTKEQHALNRFVSIKLQAKVWQ